MLQRDSAVALRMQKKGYESLTVLIPTKKAETVSLDALTTIIGTGGSNITQFIRLIRLGSEIAEEQDIDMITVQDPFFTALAGWWVKVFHKNAEFEIQLHGDFFGSDYWKRTFFGKIKMLMAEFLLKRADKVRAASQRVAKSLSSFVSEKRVKVEAVAVDRENIKSYEVKCDLHEIYGKDSKIFLSIGRIEAVKNISYLVQLFGEKVLPSNAKARLVIVGEGSDLAAVKSLVIKKKLEAVVHFEPWTDDVISYIKTADCLVLPSLSESYGRTVVESVAAGTPVVMHDVGVAGFEVKESETVRIVPVGDDYAFANEMIAV